MTQVKIERNPKQEAFLGVVLNNEADFEKPGQGKYQAGFQATFQGGRGSGKTFTLLDLIAISSFLLPRALSAVGSRTFKQVQEIILSQSQKVWEKWKLLEYDSKHNPVGNYVVNKRPPAHFRKPFTAPKTFENSITFASGYTLIYVSADRSDTQRGLNLDQYFGDESAFTKKEFMSKVIRPAIRANKYCFHDTRPHRKGYNHPLHWFQGHFSSAPYNPEGMWIYENEEKMLNEIKTKGGYQRYFHLEATAHDNLMFLPGDYIQQQREDLTDFEFQVEIENFRVRKVPNSYYPAFNYEKHTQDYYLYDFDDSTSEHITKDHSHSTMLPLHISWDFNGYFTSCIVAQEYEKEFRFIKEFWAKEAFTTLHDKVVDDFISHYRHHIKKTVYLYGDPNGNTNKTNKSDTFFEAIKIKLRLAGWTIIDCVENVYPKHKSRYKVINTLFAEDNSRLPKLRFNVDGCKSLCTSISNAAIIKDSFEKSKATEGKANVPQEVSTHLSDAFDYIIYKKFAQYIETSSARGGMMELA